MRLTKEQKSAIESLERAFAMCVKEKVYIHNCYGTLMAYDGNAGERVDDVKTDTPCNEGYEMKIRVRLDSWADDSHYVHLRESWEIKQSKE